MDLDRRIAVAPMMGCTDAHCRVLLRLISPNSLLYTEMVTAPALIHGDPAHLLAHDEDAPCAAQLGGSDPGQLAQAARLVEAAGYAEVNLNCGCPSDRVQEGGIGACLMADPHRVADCITAMQESVNIPVTVKSRIGIDDHDDFGFFQTFVETVYGTGCRVFIIHARKAILHGLSPKENREIPPLRYEFVVRIQQEFPDATFILNGGIKTAEHGLALLEDFPGIMLGRAPYSDPWLLTELENAIYGTPVPDRLDILEQYRVYIDRKLEAGQAFKNMGRHLLGFFTGQPGARAFRRTLSERMFLADADASVLTEALAISGLGEREREQPARQRGG